MISWLFKKKRTNRGFQQPDVQEIALSNSIEMRQLIHKQKLLEQKLKIAEVEAELAEYDDDDDDGLNIEKMLTDLIKNQITKAIPLLSNTPISASEAAYSEDSPPNVGKTSLTDAEIGEFIKGIPKTKLSMLKLVPSGKVQSYLKANTLYDDDTISRAINIIHNI